MGALEDSEAAPAEQLARRRRLPEELADRLLEEILERGLRSGDRLPTERELGERFGVSRTVVREAIRTLGTRGIITAQPGRGLTVAAVPASTVTASMNLFLRTNSGPVSYASVHEVRTAIEVEVAGYAARRATHVGAAQLRELHERMGELLERGQNATQEDVEFHRQLAALSGNALFLVVLDSIADVLWEVRNTTWHTPELFQLAYENHERILAAVEQRDPEAATTAMRRHLDEGFARWRTLEGGPETGSH